MIVWMRSIKKCSLKQPSISLWSIAAISIWNIAGALQSPNHRWWQSRIYYGCLVWIENWKAEWFRITQNHFPCLLRSGSGTVVSMLTFPSKGHWFDLPLPQSLKWDYKPRSRLHNLVVSGMWKLHYHASFNCFWWNFARVLKTGQKDSLELSKIWHAPSSYRAWQCFFFCGFPSLFLYMTKVSGGFQWLWKYTSFLPLLNFWKKEKERKFCP